MLIYDISYDDLKKFMVDNNQKPFRAEQVWQFVYKKKVDSFQDMSNLPSDLIELLENAFSFKALDLVVKHQSQDGTLKCLYGLHDGHLIETVLMKHHYGNSVCVTTQVGCNIGCSFCASGILKKKRDLTAGEIIAQIVQTEKLLGERINYIVVMGIGEPFDNYKNLMQFLQTVNHPKGLAIGARHITVSTSGLVPKIKEFAHMGLQVNLAISLHAPDNDTRSRLMKINDRFHVEEVVEAIKYYLAETKRRVTIEYILIDNVNDTLEHAQRLAVLLRGMNVYVNLIPYNSVLEVDYKRSTIESQMQFYDHLKKNKIQVTLRKEQGHDINAACGQLRSQHL
ncbi:MAG TPA: 23S rRNA (adenine(2503)-C(2))-methyltransferase RlmN [Acholeplasma sp.]|nr:23S rRNA (adenine(2503)-C(2))-methyltransferase RlmN [Acholeplasma sp.]